MPNYANIAELLADDMFANLMALLPLAVFVRDNDGNVVFVNEAWQEITGHHRDRALGRGWMQLLHPDDRRQLLADRHQATINRAVLQVQHRFVRPDDSIVNVMARVVPMPGSAGVIGYFGCFMDITGLIRQQQAMTSSVDQLSKALSSTSVTVSAQNRELEYLWMDNPPWIFRGKNVAGHKIQEFLPTDAATKLDGLKRKVIAGNSPARSVVSFEIDGKHLGYEFFVRPTHDGKGEVDGVLTTAVEVTDILRAKAELESTREALIKVMDQALDFSGGYRASPHRELQPKDPTPPV